MRSEAAPTAETKGEDLCFSWRFLNSEEESVAQGGYGVSGYALTWFVAWFALGTWLLPFLLRDIALLITTVPATIMALYFGHRDLPHWYYKKKLGFTGQRIRIAETGAYLEDVFGAHDEKSIVLLALEPLEFWDWRRDKDCVTLTHKGKRQTELHIHDRYLREDGAKDKLLSWIAEQGISEADNPVRD
ncbi:MAG: hypothetical protein IH944_12305 [Armatimonadetes bacterium]|nr:hypothetical protein [Armatimonadota bacterium]